MVSYKNKQFLSANILNSSQYGFRTKFSTSLAVMELIEEITNATDNKKHAIINIDGCSLELLDVI